MDLALVVDDDRILRFMVQKSLEALQIEVIAASTAEEGLLLVAERQPDVVLLDIMFARAFGLGCVARYSSHRSSPCL